MRGNKQVLTILVSGLVGVVIGFVVGGLIFGFAGGGLLGAGVTGGGGNQPSYGSAVVDGNYVSDWNLSADFFSNMYRAGNTSKPVESKLYLRYDCDAEVMYVLVKTVQGVSVLNNLPGDAYVKINGAKRVDGNSGNDGTPPDFAWVGYKFGYEASFGISPGSYDLNVHVQVDDGGAQTSAVPNRSIPLTIECYEPTAVFLNYFKAEAASTGGVMLSWQTASEVNNLGFNVYSGASPAGPWTKLNPSLIPSQSPGGMSGANYTWLDPQGNVRLYYLLEDVDMNGTVTQHGPVRVTSAGFFGGGTIKP